MRKDNKRYENPSKFDAEYGVIQNTYVEQEPEYNSNRRTVQSKKNSRLLPGVSPLVYSRFLLDKAAFLSLTDMGKDLPEYEEIPVALKMPAAVEAEYKEIEKELKFVLKNDKKAAKKILSAYLNLLTAYPDQPYEQKPVYHPLDGHPIVTPEDTVAPGTILPKDEEVLNIVERKIAAGEKVLIYTNWTRLDSQMRLQTLLTARGWNTIIMPAKVKPAKREQWVADRLSAGLQVLIANPTLVQTGLDLNAFTTLIFYDTGYKLFTLRQASRRSWRINQTAPRVEVYMFYYRDTMQHKAIKLMASKLAVAGIIEGSFSEEGLAAMSECEDNLIPYSGNMWGTPHKDDLSRCSSYPEFVEKLNYIVQKLFMALRRDGRLAILVGDIRTKGSFYSMQHDLMRVGQMEAFIVKGQYNCVSDTRSYKKPFIPVVTEYLLLFHKQDALFFPFAVRRETTVDLRKEDIPGLTWHHLIRLTMEELSGRAKLSDLGDRLAAHPKAKKNPHFRDRIRATAYEHPGQYISCGNGFYALNYAVA